MANMMRKVSDYFGLTPSDNERYEAEGYDDYDRREVDTYADEYRSDRDLRDREDMPRREERESRYESRRPVDLRPMDTPVEPQHIFVEPKSDFQDRYSNAPEIGRHFRDGDIVTFDLSELDPAQQKRYLDFAAGLAFALRGRIKADGPVITLLPEGVSPADIERDRMSV
ncbi:cell division protein SepF [Corynebacterium sp. H78]|uniref:cell division protein SepF n=1 Tax=Corynebacterium sp. H78 TaxID=3133417 RepID=UPI003097E081